MDRAKNPAPPSSLTPFLPGVRGPTAALPARATASAIIQKLVNNSIQNCLVHSQLPTIYELQVEFNFLLPLFIMTPFIPNLDARPTSSLRYVRPLFPPIFDTFHSNTTALPTEITTHILGYIVADARPSPLGGGVRTHAAHHPVASVSRAFRSIYLNQPYSTSTKGRETTPVKLRIGEILEFCDLRTLAAFFEDGPGRDTIIL